MSQFATISSDVLVGLYSAVCSEGIDPFDVSDACRLSRAVWFSRGNAILLRDFVRILEQVAQSTGKPDFGWRAGQTFDLHFLGELGDTILSAPTLGLALKTFSGFLRLIQTTTVLDFQVDSDRAVIAYRILDPDIWPRRQDAEFTLSIFRGLLESCFQDGCHSVSMAFEHGKRTAGGDVQSTTGFDGQPNVMVFPVRYLDAVMGSSDRFQWRERSQRLKMAMTERDRNQPVSAKTEAAILEDFGKETPSQHRIAAELGLSSRSLHRHLRAEGETFSHILTDCRIRYAKHMLAHGNQPLAQVALDLGFEDQSCFTRLFRMSTGVSPSSFRATAAESAGLA